MSRYIQRAIVGNPQVRKYCDAFEAVCERWCTVMFVTVTLRFFVTTLMSHNLCLFYCHGMKKDLMSPHEFVEYIDRLAPLMEKAPCPLLEVSQLMALAQAPSVLVIPAAAIIAVKVTAILERATVTVINKLGKTEKTVCCCMQFVCTCYFAVPVVLDASWQPMELNLGQGFFVTDIVTLRHKVGGGRGGEEGRPPLPVISIPGVHAAGTYRPTGPVVRVLAALAPHSITSFGGVGVHIASS